MAFKITPSCTSPLIFKPVFDIWFSDERYQHWKRNKEATWQLRCVGGPGSGKTQFSSQVVQNLQNEYEGKNVAIVPIFLDAAKNCSKRPNAAITSTFLTEVEGQLENILLGPQQEGVVSSLVSIEESLTKTRISSESDADIRQRVVSKRASFERAFIIVDDLDIVRQYPEEYHQLEEEFLNLQNSNFKIFTTSRVPYKPDPLVGFCDVHGTEDKPVEGPDDPVRIWWECPLCVGEGGDEYYICDGCFEDGHRCQIVEHKDIPLIQRRDRVNFDIGTPPLSNFVKYHLELTHGDLGLQSQANLPEQDQRVLPPLSPLGHALKAPGNQAGMEERINTLIDETGDNITIALLQLEHISLGETVDIVGAQSDRLPRNIVASFDAGIAYIMRNQDELRRDLGMKAIQIVGKRGMVGIPFDELRESIVEAWPPSDKSRIEGLLESEDSVEELLSASNGFLNVRFNPGSDEPYIECFHKDFDLYVAEDYGNSLVTFTLPFAEDMNISR